MEFWDYCSEILEIGEVEKDSLMSIARGGPIFVQDLLSHPTCVPVFESEVFHEVEDLKNIVGSDSNVFDEDISVDELKLHTDEDLVSEAMKIAFEVDEEAISLSDLAVQPYNSGAADGPRVLAEKCENNKRTPKCLVSLGQGKKSTKDEESYIGKLEPLVRIRQKQEEDKATVKLHSFNHSKQKSVAVSSRNLETLRCLDSPRWPPQVKYSATANHVEIQYPEVVLCVEVYHNKQSWKKTQELLVLGRQPLTELKDKIHCVTDAIMQKAVKNKDNDHPEIIHDPSGYFLVEELFCNDMRDQSAINYSEPILDWLKNSKEKALAKWEHISSGVGKAPKVLLGDRPESTLPNFRSVNMERTRFCDLRFRLGAGYLYCHQGDCKHVIVFRDMRMIHPDDVQNRAAYPLTVYQLKRILKKCSVCHIYKATRVTCDDKWAGENPCYFCEQCYFLLHYSEEGQLLHDPSDYKVFDYLQDYN